MKQMQSQGMNESVQSLSVLMPSLGDLISSDQEDRVVLEMRKSEWIRFYFLWKISFSSDQ